VILILVNFDLKEWFGDKNENMNIGKLD